MTATQIANIKTFPSLVKYLRDELEWPVKSDDFEQLTFEFDAEELGIDLKNAAKFNYIKQLRPLTTNQPWGIFFVAFEPERLPVVALRKMLAGLAIKRRASANKAERAAWKLNDLLFISEFGEGDDRQITLAHFSQGASNDEIPTLKVLGWDEFDTQLNLRHVDHELHERLRWPDNTSDLDGWRKRWSAAFVLRHRQVIHTAKDLAERLAVLASSIREKAKQVLDIETDRGPLQKLCTAFREALIHDLTEDSFADMYAQTITYGLFSAAVSRTVPGEGTVVLPENLADMVPITNPFLREMLSTFLTVGGRKGKLDFDELGIQEVVEVLNSKDTDLNAVLRNFGDRRPGEDPVIHFYEDFLKQYDKKLKVQRGVFYTPQPVVSYIVRSVHELLQTEFGLEDGLASTVTWGEMVQKHHGLKIPDGAKADDPFIVILDPATGTATFLVEVIDIIFRTMTEKWNRQRLSPVQQLNAWNKYVPAHMLPRLYGYELMMAPYAIAHMKIGLKLSETGYRFGTEERARVYLTNALEPWLRQLPLIGFEVLAHEAAAVNEIKRQKRFTVVIGNPPYAGHSWNLTPELRKIVDPYRFVGTERIIERGALQLEKNLQDDYVKFICFAEQKIKSANVGVCGLVTSHGFLDNAFLRGMRHSLLSTYDALSILDLHGNVLRGDKCPDGSPDKNVFDIKQTGVAISLFTRNIEPKNRSVRHADLFGDRDTVKTPFLLKHTLSSTNLSLLQPSTPSWLFIPRDASLSKEYETAPSLVDVMPLRSLAVVTGRDAFVIDESEDALVERMTAFASANGTEEELDEKYGLRSSTWWSSSTARREMPRPKQIRDHIRLLDYRPFDRRFCFYHPSVFESLRRPVMQHLDSGRNNVVLITTRMVKGEPFAHTFISNGLTEAIGLSSKTSNSAYVFPLYVYPDPEGSLIDSERYGNFSKGVLSSLGRAFGMPPKPEDIFHYAYAVFHSPLYRSRYAEFLKFDFPRLPLTGKLELFRSLARLGSELAALHLLESPTLAQPITEHIRDRRPEVEKISWSRDTVWVDKAQTAGFRGVREEVWNFHIGGYQVCEKWLKDRKGRKLLKADIEHYQKIVVALSETIRLMKEIDEVIDQHGGWPGAFITEPIPESKGEGQATLPFE